MLAIGLNDMTIIASITRSVSGGFEEILIGDMLITSHIDIDKGKTFNLPTGKIESLVDKKMYFPVDLSQKIVIINSNVVFSWAGRFVFAKWAVEKIKGLLEDASFENLDEFDALFEIISEECTEDDAFILSIRGGSGKTRKILHKNCWSITTEDGQWSVVGIGSGFYDFYSQFSKISDRSVDNLIQFGTLVIAANMAKEVVNASCTQNYFGGAWEICFYNDGYRKFENVLYSTYQVDKTNASEWKIVPVCALKYKYVGDDLFLKSALDLSGLEDYTWRVSAPGASAGDVGIPEIDMESEYQVVGIVEVSGTKWKSYVGAAFSKDRDEWAFRKGEVGYEFNGSFLEMIFAESARDGS